MRKIKKNDEVVVLTGKNRKVHGKVLRVVAKGTKVVVEGVNLLKKHVKPNPNTQTQGGIIKREAPVHISNVAIYNPGTRKADRVVFKVLQDGKKVRCFKSNGELIEVV